MSFPICLFPDVEIRRDRGRQGGGREEIGRQGGDREEIRKE